jgi:predicted O-linked N-acetylglucosamine transferase (SPINDLY family)
MSLSVMMTEAIPVELDDYRQQAVKCLLEGNYVQAADFYQRLIEIQPEVRTHAWNLGLALLLQGQEAEAQTIWMLAMVEGDAAQVSQWTAELVAVLSTEAERRESSDDAAIAWAIRQHIREIAPDDLTNQLHLLQLSMELDRFTVSEITNANVLSLLKSEQARLTVDPNLLLQTLKSLLKFAPLEPEVLNFAEACFQHSLDSIPLVLVLVEQAIEVSSVLRQPLVAVNYIKCCLKACPNDPNLLAHLSFFYQNGGEHDQAIEAARTFCTLATALPDQVFAAFVMLKSLMKAGGYWDNIFPIFEHQDFLIEQLVNTQVEPLDQTTVFKLTTSTFCQPYIRDSLVRNRLNQNRLMGLCQSSVEVYEKERFDRYQRGFARRKTHRDPTKPLRIGYVSYCMRQHSVGWLSRWLFQHHNREQFQIYGYFWNAQLPVTDSLQQWFVQHVDEARILGRDSGEIADRIFEDEIDILIEMDSITADIICEVIMLKPAPVQVTWLGWDASGIPAVDYYIADPYVLPDYAEQHYSEKLWRLPQTYLAVDGFEVEVPTLRREDLHIPADAVVYWSGQSSYKRHPETVRSQLQIVQAVPNSYLLIKGITDETSIQQYFLQMAADVGIDSARLRFLPDVTTEAVHRANLAIADVVLDTYPYNGATTTLETLWMGIPLVTRVGEHFSSRNSYTMMVNAGITEGIAWTNEEYVEWGIRLGKAPELRQQVAWKLWKSRQTAPLWNARAFTQEMEKAYKQMWQGYVNA